MVVVVVEVDVDVVVQGKNFKRSSLKSAWTPLRRVSPVSRRR